MHNIVNTKEVWMDNPEEDLNGLQLWSLNELVGPTAFQSYFCYL